MKIIITKTTKKILEFLKKILKIILQISCNYSSMLGGKVQTAAALRVHGPQPSLIQPRGKIELGNPVLMQMGPVRSERQSGEGPLIQVNFLEFFKNFRDFLGNWDKMSSFYFN